MLTEAERIYKKHHFIYGKWEEIWNTFNKCSTVHRNVLGFAKLVTELEALTFSVNGVGSVSKIEEDNTYRITDTSGECWIDICFFSQKACDPIVIIFTVNMFGFQSPYCNYLNCDVHDFLSNVMLQFEKIKAEYLYLSQNIEKSDKLTGVTLAWWLLKILKNNDYFYIYYIDVSDNEYTLQIKLNQGLQLDIPICHKKNPKIMSNSLTVIRQCANLVDSSNVKVLISTYNILHYDVPKAAFDIIEDSILELQNFLNDTNYKYSIEESLCKYTLHLMLIKEGQLDIQVYPKKIRLQCSSYGMLFCKIKTSYRRQ